MLNTSLSAKFTIAMRIQNNIYYHISILGIGRLIISNNFFLLYLALFFFLTYGRILHKKDTPIFIRVHKPKQMSRKSRCVLSPHKIWAFIVCSVTPKYTSLFILNYQLQSVVIGATCIPL